MRPEVRLFQYIKEAFTPHQLPKPPAGKVNKADQAEYQRELRRARAIKEIFRQRRFAILKVTGLVVGGTIVAAATPRAIDFIRGIASITTSPDIADPIIGPSEYSGDVAETSMLIRKWGGEVRSDLNKLENYTPRIINLAIAYFSTQMTEMFPDKAGQYRRDRFNIVPLAINDYVREASRCGQRVGSNEPFSADPQTTKVIFSTRILHQILINKSKGVEETFYGLIHELMHVVPPLIRNGEGLFTQALKEPVVFKKGLNAYFVDPTEKVIEGQDCNYKSWWYQAEEGVADHATAKLTERVGVYGSQTGYIAWVNSYENQIVRPMFNGRFQELLAYQQATYLDGFLAAIGRQVYLDAPYEAQTAVGSHIATQVFK